MISYQIHMKFGLILKLKRFSHLSGQSFELGPSIRLRYLSMMLSLRADIWRERAT